MARFLTLTIAFGLFCVFCSSPLLPQSVLAAEARQQQGDKSINPNALKPKLQDAPAETIASLTQDCADARSVCEQACKGKSAAQTKSEICAKECGPMDVICSAAKAKQCNSALDGVITGALNKAFNTFNVCVAVCVEKKTDACQKVDAAYKEMLKTIQQSGFKPK